MNTRLTTTTKIAYNLFFLILGTLQVVSELGFNTKRPNGSAKNSLQKINYVFEILLTNKKFLSIKIFTLQDSNNTSDHEHGRR